MNLHKQSLPPQPRWHSHLVSITLVLAFFIAPFAMAQNVGKVSYEFNEGDTIPLALSSININRLVVKNDRILSIVCPKGFCTSSGNQKDASGSITLKINIALPFTAHLTTEKGRLFALFITPKSTPALVTEFVWSESYKEQKSPIALAADYPAAMTALTKSMMRFVHDAHPLRDLNATMSIPKRCQRMRPNWPSSPKPSLLAAITLASFTNSKIKALKISPSRRRSFTAIPLAQPRSMPTT